MNAEFPFYDITNFYPYRTALVHGFSIDDDRNHNLYKKVREFLEANNYRMDNHICFTIENGQNFMWSDGTLTIGNLTIRKW